MAGDEGKAAQLNLSLYGTRDAPQNLAETYTKLLVECGFTRGRGSMCNFELKRKKLIVTVNGNDCTSCGPTASFI